MRYLASLFGIAMIAALTGVQAIAVEDGKFAAVSKDMAADASSVGFDITGSFEKAGGVVTVGEIPPYVDPQQGLVMMVSVIAKAGSKLIEQCEVGTDYPIEVNINGSKSRTTTGRCREYLKNPCIEGICTFWTTGSAG